MPDGVETACNRNQRIPERVTHPDPEHGILLAQRLAGFDRTALPAAGNASGSKLDDSAEHGNQSHPNQRNETAAAVYYGAGAHENGYSE